MTFSIVIGLVQIIFGKTVAAFKMKAQKGVKYSIAPFAWVFVITALALAFGLPMLNLQLPETVKTVFIGIAVIGFGIPTTWLPDCWVTPCRISGCLQSV